MMCRNRASPMHCPPPSSPAAIRSLSTLHPKPADRPEATVNKLDNLGVCCTGRLVILASESPCS